MATLKFIRLWIGSQWIGQYVGDWCFQSETEAVSTLHSVNCQTASRLLAHLAYNVYNVIWIISWCVCLSTGPARQVSHSWQHGIAVWTGKWACIHHLVMLVSLVCFLLSLADIFFCPVTVNLQFTWSKAAELIDQTVSTLTLNWISENVAVALVKNLVWIQGLYCTPFLYGYSRGILDPRRSFRLHSETFKVKISFVCWTSYQCNITEMVYCWDIVTVIKRLTGCGLSVIWHHFI